MPMESSPDKTDSEERRRAVRYPIEAQVTIHTKSGQSSTAKAVNISSSGMLLQLPQPFSLNPGDEVTVEVDLPDEPDKALASWGLGTVVRLDGLGSAVHLSAGHFDWESQFGGTDR
jgi:hypothetical protein